MNFIFFIMLLFSNLSILAMDAFEQNEDFEIKLERILRELEQEIVNTKNNEESLIYILRSENMIDQEAILERKNCLEKFIQHLRQSHYYAKLQEQIEIVITAVPESPLPMEIIEEYAAKVLVQIVKNVDCVGYFSHILRRYERCIKENHSLSVAQNKAASFFFLFLVNNVIFEKSYKKIKTDKKDTHKKRGFYRSIKKISTGNLKNIDKKISSEKTNESNFTILLNQNILSIATLIQKWVGNPERFQNNKKISQYLETIFDIIYTEKLTIINN